VPFKIVIMADEATACGSPVRPNYAFERPVKPRTSARGQRTIQFAPSARLRAPRPAAQRER